MKPRARPSLIVSIILPAIAFAIAAASTPAEALAVGDYWVYAYYQPDHGAAWIGNLTQEYIGSVPGNLLGFRVSGGGRYQGDITGTWNVTEVDGYRPTDGAFVNSTSTQETRYVQFGNTFHIVTVTTSANNPPVDLGGPLKPGAKTSGSTTETVTQTRTVNDVASAPVTQSSPITLTEEVIGRFQVSVPVGVFTAWQIRFTRSDTLGYVEYAYNETVGSNVRVEVIDGTGLVVASLSLRKYSYQSGAAGLTTSTGALAVPLAAIGATGAVVAAIVWRDRRRPPRSVAGGPGAPFVPPPPQPPPPAQP